MKRATVILIKVNHVILVTCATGRYSQPSEISSQTYIFNLWAPFIRTYCIYVSMDVRTRRYFSKPKGVREEKVWGKKTGIEQSKVDNFFCMSRHSHAIIMETHSLHGQMAALFATLPSDA